MHTDTIGYKIRLLHNQIHKRMEAKRQENEKRTADGNAALDAWLLRIMTGKIFIRRISKQSFPYRGQLHQICLQSWRGKGLCAVRRWSMMRD